MCIRRVAMLWLVFGGACRPTPGAAAPVDGATGHPLEKRASENTSAGALEPPLQPVAPPADLGRCLRSRFCELEGLCSVDERGQCIAQSDDDCRPSDACKGGRCTARRGQCIAASDQDCRGSWACKAWGRCNHDGAEACMATAEADCTASTRCKREGECTLAGGACVSGR